MVVEIKFELYFKWTRLRNCRYGWQEKLTYGITRGWQIFAGHIFRLIELTRNGPFVWAVRSRVYRYIYFSFSFSSHSRRHSIVGKQYPPDALLAFFLQRCKIFIITFIFFSRTSPRVRGKRNKERESSSICAGERERYFYRTNPKMQYSTFAASLFNFKINSELLISRFLSLQRQK